MLKDRATIIVVSIVVLLFAAVLYLYYFHAEVISKDINRGYTKQAKRNPYLAAELYLQERKVPAEFTLRYSLLNRIGDENEASDDHIRAGDTVILENARGTLSGEHFDMLKQWVANGGTLILSMENRFLGSRAIDDMSQWLDVGVTSVDYSNFDEVSEDKAETDAEKEPEEKPVPSETPKPSFVYSDLSSCRKGGGYELTAPRSDEALHVHYYGGPPFIALGENEPNWHSSEEHGNNPPYVSSAIFSFGEGEIVLVRSTLLWRNPWIQCHDNAYFLWSLINPRGKVWLLENRDAPSLFVLMWRYLHVGVFLIFITISILLWSAFVRFGPTFTRTEDSRRRFSEHIKADALFVWKRRGLVRLLATLRARVEARLLRKIHAYDKKSAHEKITSIRQFVDLDAQQLGLALFSEDIKSSAEFIESIRILKKLKENL